MATEIVEIEGTQYKVDTDEMTVEEYDEILDHIETLVDNHDALFGYKDVRPSSVYSYGFVLYYDESGLSPGKSNLGIERTDAETDFPYSINIECIEADMSRKSGNLSVYVSLE